MLKAKHKPKDVRVEIRFENTFEKVNVKDAGQYYDNFLGVSACFDVTKSDTELRLWLRK